MCLSEGLKITLQTDKQEYYSLGVLFAVAALCISGLSWCLVMDFMDGLTDIFTALFGYFCMRTKSLPTDHFPNRRQVSVNLLMTLVVLCVMWDFIAMCRMIQWYAHLSDTTTMADWQQYIFAGNSIASCVIYTTIVVLGYLLHLEIITIHNETMAYAYDFDPEREPILRGGRQGRRQPHPPASLYQDVPDHYAARPSSAGLAPRGAPAAHNWGQGRVLGTGARA